MARLPPDLRPGPPKGPPGAQRSFARSRCYLSQSDVQHHLRGHYPSFVAHMTSCDRPNPSRRLRFPLVGRSLQVVASPCWEMALPDVISARLSLDARAPITAVCEVLIPVSSPTASAFPALSSGRLFRNFPPKRLLSGSNFATAAISLCSGLQVCSPSRSFPPLRIIRRAAMAFTSERNIRRYRRMHRIC